jgi:hypothetical protein
MAKHEGGPAGEQFQAEVDLRHLRREVRTALELAVVAFAPSDLVDRLASAAGLLEALNELTTDSPPAMALVARVVPAARSGLQEWQLWRSEQLDKKIPRG